MNTDTASGETRWIRKKTQIQIQLLWRRGEYKYKYIGANFIQIQLLLAPSVELDTPGSGVHINLKVSQPCDCRCAPPAGPSFAGQSSRATTPPTSASRMATARSPSRPGKTANTADTSEFSLKIDIWIKHGWEWKAKRFYPYTLQRSFVVIVGTIDLGRQVCNWLLM